MTDFWQLLIKLSSGLLGSTCSLRPAPGLELGYGVTVGAPDRVISLRLSPSLTWDRATHSVVGPELLEGDRVTEAARASALWRE